MAKQRTLFEQLKSTEQHDSISLQSPLSSLGMRISIIFICVVLTGLMFPNQSAINENGEDVRQVNSGVLWMNESIKADFPFAIARPESEIEQERASVLANTPMVCQESLDSRTEAEAKLSALLQICDGKLQESGLFSEISSKTIADLSAQTKEVIVQVLTMYRNEIISTYYERRPLISGTLSTLPDTVFIRHTASADIPMLKQRCSDTLIMRNQLIGLLGDKLQMREAEKVVNVLIGMFKPRYEISKVLSQELKENRLSSIPRTLGIVRAGEMLIRKGERFDRMSSLKVQSYVRNRANTENSVFSWLIFIGGLGHSFLIFSMLMLYLYFIRPVIFVNHQQLFGLLGIIMIAPFMSWLTVLLNSSYPLEFGVIVPALSMLIAIVYDSRTAFYSTVVMSLLIAGVRGSDYSVGLSMMIAGMVAAYSVRDIQARTQLFSSILYVFLGMSLSIASIGAERSLSWIEMYPQFMVAGINAVFSPIVTFGVLYVIERIFPVTTDLKIDEYDTLEHPLLLEMNEKAPGTFQHTMTIARLVESAAHAIHANALLAVVGVPLAKLLLFLRKSQWIIH